MSTTKLPSGSYRVQKQINGKRYSFTFDHKPTQKELLACFAQKEGARNGSMTFAQACDLYVSARTNTLSPSTIRGYKGIMKMLPDDFMGLLIDDMTANDVQREINILSAKLTPKTVRNYHGFISSILAEFRPNLILHTHLPMKDAKVPYIPSKEDVKALLGYAHGTRYEVPLLLACASLRRGEICALTMDDVEGNTIHVTKDMVLTEDNRWVIKPPKTVESVRDVVVPDSVIDAINRNGLYKGSPSSISHWMNEAQKKLGLNQFSIHKLRHYFASAAHEAGVSDADIMKAGGWKTDHVMKSVYRHSLADDNSKATNAVFKNIIP